MRVVAAGTGPIRQAPFPNGPGIEVLVDEQAGRVGVRSCSRPVRQTGASALTTNVGLVG
jgi:hypothetical protein